MNDRINISERPFFHSVCNHKTVHNGFATYSRRRDLRPKRIFREPLSRCMVTSEWQLVISQCKQLSRQRLVGTLRHRISNLEDEDRRLLTPTSAFLHATCGTLQCELARSGCLQSGLVQFWTRESDCGHATLGDRANPGWRYRWLNEIPGSSSGTSRAHSAVLKCLRG